MNQKIPAVIKNNMQVPSRPRFPLLSRSFVNLRTSFTWAWLDTKCQYRRSRIGPLWDTINVAVMIAGLTIVSSGLFGGSMRSLIGYLALGIIIWSAISTLVLEGCDTFVRNASHILGSNISIDLYIGRTVFKAFIIFCHHFILFFIGIALGFVSLTWTGLLALPGIILVFANGIWVVAVLAFICARYRDIIMIVRSLLQLAFLVTPVFWNYQQIATNRRFIVDYNVLFYFIQIVRLPLLGTAPSTWTYLIVIATTFLGYLLAAVTYYGMRKRLAFFV
jgi:ABC-type polysaccharide/polyol phosphate export permease